MEYKEIKGEGLEWLYVDLKRVSVYGCEYGLKGEVVKEGSDYEYLGKVRL